MKVEDDADKGVDLSDKVMSFNDLFKSEGMTDEELSARAAYSD